MTPRASAAADATPLSDADRHEFIAERAAPLPFLHIGIVATLPLLGSIGFYLREDMPHAKRDREWNVRLLNYEIWAEMPEESGGYLLASQSVRRIGPVVWRALCVPVLLVALALQMLRTLMLGSSDWRFRRACLHFARRACPEDFDARVRAWRDHPVIGREAMRLFEERRVAERMAALGGA